VIEALLRRPEWEATIRVDNRLVSNLSVRERFDAAFRVPEVLKGHTPALFHPRGAIIGESALRAVLTQPVAATAGSVAAPTDGFPWGEWADACLAGSSLLIMALLLGPYNDVARALGLGLLAATFLVSGVDKALHPADFAATVGRMSLLPPGVARLAPLLGYVETGLGAALLLPRTRMASLSAVCALLLLFCATTVALLARDYAGNCGCMPWSESVTAAKVVNDGAAFALAVCMAHGHRRRSELASYLAR
jgi:uncharacterized membrane protein